MSSPSGRRPQRGGEAFPFFRPALLPMGRRGHGEGSFHRVIRVRPSRFVLLFRGRNGGRVLPSGLSSASRWKPFGSDAREGVTLFGGPAQASWPEAATRVSRPSPSKPASRSGSSPRSEAQFAVSAELNSGGDGHHARREHGSSVPLERRVRSATRPCHAPLSEASTRGSGSP